MSHSAQLAVIAEVVATNRIALSQASVLEVGSYDVNGSIRHLVAGRSYLGIDLVSGPNVDRVCRVEDLQVESQSFDAVISCEAFEHDSYWRETLRLCWNVLKPGGILLVTCASLGRPEHGTIRTDASMSPGTSSIGQNHYENVRLSELQLALQELDEVADSVTLYSSYHFDLVLIAVRGGSREPESGAYQTFKIPKRVDLERALRSGSFLSWMSTRPLLLLAWCMSEANYQAFAIRYIAFVRIIKKRLAPPYFLSILNQ